MIYLKRLKLCVTLFFKEIKMETPIDKELIRLSETEPARYEHDCDVCVYLGRYKEYDLYFCNNHTPTVIARYGIHGEYLSGMRFARPDSTTSLYEAKKRAIKYGIYNE